MSPLACSLSHTTKLSIVAVHQPQDQAALPTSHRLGFDIHSVRAIHVQRCDIKPHWQLMRLLVWMAVEGSGPIVSKLNFENTVKECVPKIREWLLLFTFFLGEILQTMFRQKEEIRSKNSQNKRNVLNNYLTTLQIDLRPLGGGGTCWHT